MAAALGGGGAIPWRKKGQRAETKEPVLPGTVTMGCVARLVATQHRRSGSYSADIAGPKSADVAGPKSADIAGPHWPKSADIAGPHWSKSADIAGPHSHGEVY